PRRIFGYTAYVRCAHPPRRENQPMRAAVQLSNRERNTMTDMRALADQAFSRAAGAPLIEGNSVRLLKDARENYPAWLEAIGAAPCPLRELHYSRRRGGTDIRRGLARQGAGRRARAPDL